MKRGVYILPNLFTTASLFFGFYAIAKAIQIVLVGGQNFHRCGVAILLAAIFDGMDGRVARKTGTATRFGVEYDSLADLVSFGMAPAIVVYVWALRGLGRIGWLAAFLYVACGALRLARFNVQATGSAKPYFEGLPIPAAAGVLAGTVLIWDGQPVGDASLFFSGDVQYYVIGLTYLLSVLMVSTIPYRSFKTLALTSRHPFYTLFFVVLGFTLWATKPWWILYLAGCAFILSGPIERYVLARPVSAIKKAKKKRRVRKSLERIDQMASDFSEREKEKEGKEASEQSNIHAFPKT